MTHKYVMGPQCIDEGGELESNRKNAYIDDLVQYYSIANAPEILQCSTDTSILFVNICRDSCGYRG